MAFGTEHILDGHAPPLDDLQPVTILTQSKPYNNVRDAPISIITVPDLAIMVMIHVPT